MKKYLSENDPELESAHAEETLCIQANQKILYPFDLDSERAISFQSMEPYLDIFNEYGVLVFRNFFDGDPLYDSFYTDLVNLASIIIEKHDLNIDTSAPLNKILTQISKTHRKEIGFIYDLGTRPLKLTSGVKLKSHNAIIKMLNAVMGEDAILAHPYLGETLHIFPPGDENFKYNLPMHQDYPYILQSPEQVTAYINLGCYQDNSNNGGIRIWPGSHKEGISSSTVLPNSLRITSNAEHFIEQYQSIDINFDQGDFAIFNSLLQHEGIQNHTDCTRVVQLVRYSNLRNEVSTQNHWQSSEGISKGLQFAEVHKDLTIDSDA